MSTKAKADRIVWGQARFGINHLPHFADHDRLGGIAAVRKLNLEIDLLAHYLKQTTEALV